MTVARQGHTAAVGRVLLRLGLWVLAACGALATAFFVAMLLTPGYGDAVIAVLAGLAALLTVAAGLGLRRLGRDRRARAGSEVDHVLQGQLLEQVPPSRRRWTITALASGVLLAASVGIVVGGAAPGLLLVVLFGAAFAVSVVALVPGACWLRVTTRGLAVRHLWRVRAHRWEDADGFRAYVVSTRFTTLHLVGWTASDRARAQRPAARWLRWPSGVDDGLPTEYEGDAEELAARLQQHRDEHVGRSAPVR